MNLSEFDQLVYSLPTATGSSLFELTSPKVFKEVKPEIKEIPDVIKPSPDNLPLPDVELQQSLGLMAQTIDNIQQRLEQNGEAFISPDERPAVGEQALNEV
jgi:hypothetical protein